jgi:hypothetical protein
MLTERLDAIAGEDLVVHHDRLGAEHLIVGRSGVFLVNADRRALHAVREALDARGLVAMPATMIGDHDQLEKTIGEDRRFGLRVVTRACAALGVPDGVPFVATVASADEASGGPVAGAVERDDAQPRPLLAR